MTGVGATAGVKGGTAPATEAPRLEITTSRQFVSWLAGSGGSLAFTTYQSGKVFLIGSKRDRKKLSIFERTLERPMGMAVSGPRLAIASMNQVTTFVDAAGGIPTKDGYDAVYVRGLPTTPATSTSTTPGLPPTALSCSPTRCSRALPR